MSELLPEYRQRQFRFEGLWQCDSTRFKVYSIHQAAATAHAGTALAGARSYLDQQFPALRAEEGNDHGLGYVILHHGEITDWLLIHWWAHSDIILASLASSPERDGRFQCLDNRPFHACVWEHVVIHHEYSAWIRHMNRPTGEEEAYLTDRLANGFY